MITVTLDKVNGSDVTNDIRAISFLDIVPGSFRPLTANNTATAALFKIKTQDSNGNPVYEQWQITETYAATLTAISNDAATAGAQLVSNLVTSISAGSTDAQYPSAKLLYDQLLLKANLASPTLTGVPLAPTAAPGTDTTQISTTAFVQAAIVALIGGAPGALDTLNELAAALADDANYATTITNALALKAALASPTFTGTPAAPTAAPGDNSTQLATTAFVDAARVILAAATALKEDAANKNAAAGYAGLTANKLQLLTNSAGVFTTLDATGNTVSRAIIVPDAAGTLALTNQFGKAISDTIAVGGDRVVADALITANSAVSVQRVVTGGVVAAGGYKVTLNPGVGFTIFALQADGITTEAGNTDTVMATIIY